MASKEDVAWAAQHERSKTRDAIIYWKDGQENIIPVPIVQMTDTGSRWQIEIFPPKSAAEPLESPCKHEWFEGRCVHCRRPSPHDTAQETRLAEPDLALSVDGPYCDEHLNDVRAWCVECINCTTERKNALRTL